MSQRSSSLPESSAPIANANGTVEPDVAEVQQRRMGEHVRVLEARRHSGAVERRRLRRERARDRDDEEREERRDGREDGHDPHDQVARPRADSG